MNKCITKSSFWFLSIVLAWTLIGCSKDEKTFSSQGICPFCDKAVLDAQTIYEDDLVLALTTHKPIFPGHTLVIPKRHVERFEQLNEKELVRMGEIISKVDQAVSQAYSTSAYLLLQKNGKEAGQSVMHVHFHYIPKKAQQTASALYFFYRMCKANFKKPLSSDKMAHTIKKMQKVWENTQN